MELTPRDRKIIQEVARFHFLSSTQILRIVDGAGPQLLRRLQLLYHHGWLDRPRCQIDYYHNHGSRPMVYGLGSRGVAMMRREYDVPFASMVWGRGGEDVGRVFLDHTLMVAETIISVEIACREQDGVNFISSEALENWQGVKKPLRWTTRDKNQRVGLVPDAVFGVELENAPAHSKLVICCLEADRGSMPVTRRSPHLSSLSRKFASYAKLWKAGEFEKRFGTKRLVVLTVTTSKERVGNMEDALESLPYGKGIFASYEQSEVCPDASAILQRCAPGLALQGQI